MSHDDMHMTVKAMRLALGIKIDQSQPQKALVCGREWRMNRAINVGGFQHDDGGFWVDYYNGQKIYSKVTCAECIKVLKSKGL